MYQQLGEKGSEMENLDYQTKKVDDLQKRISSARFSSNHVELVKASTLLCALFTLLSK